MTPPLTSADCKSRSWNEKGLAGRTGTSRSVFQTYFLLCWNHRIVYLAHPGLPHATAPCITLNMRKVTSQQQRPNRAWNWISSPKHHLLLTFIIWTCTWLLNFLPIYLFAALYAFFWWRRRELVLYPGKQANKQKNLENNFYGARTNRHQRTGQIVIKFKQILCCVLQQILDNQQRKTLLLWMLRTPNGNTIPPLLWGEMFVFKLQNSLH